MTEEKQDLLTDLDKYLKVGVHIGTKYRTKYMAPFIYRIRPDGLAVLNVQKIDERLKVVSKFLAQFDPKDILVACRRENGWRAIKMFAELTGARAYPGRYPPGILTNPQLDNFIEAKVIVVVDPWPDRNVIKDAMRIGIPIVALCDTNNEATNIDLVIPCNNKGKKSLGLVFWILSKEFLGEKKLIKSEKEMKYSFEEFIPE